MKRNSATPDRVPGFVEPMQAKLVDSMPAGDWIHEQSERFNLLIVDPDGGDLRSDNQWQKTA